MTRQQGTTSYRHSYTYVEGNTVRKVNAAPARMPREQEVVRQNRQVDRRAMENRERAMQMNPAYMVFLTLAMIATVFVCIVYINLQAQYSQNRRTIATLESQLLELTTDNDALEKRIETSVNLDDVRTVAMTELGMVHPSEDQIVYYKVETKDYMNLYQQIPD